MMDAYPLRLPTQQLVTNYLLSLTTADGVNAIGSAMQQNPQLFKAVLESIPALKALEEKRLNILAERGIIENSENGMEIFIGVDAAKSFRSGNFGQPTVVDLENIPVSNIAIEFLPPKTITPTELQPTVKTKAEVNLFKLVHHVNKINVTAEDGTIGNVGRNTAVDMCDYHKKPYPWMEVVEAFLHNRRHVDRMTDISFINDPYQRLVDMRTLRLSGPRQCGKSKTAELTVVTEKESFLISALKVREDSIVPFDQILILENSDEFTKKIKKASIIVIDQQGFETRSGKLHKRLLKRFKANPEAFHPDLRLIVIH